MILSDCMIWKPEQKKEETFNVDYFDYGELIEKEYGGLVEAKYSDIDCSNLWASKVVLFIDVNMWTINWFRSHTEYAE